VFLAVSALFADELLYGDSFLTFANRDSFRSGLLAEALFVQNYADGLWSHTWTLAVEEHFYLLLAVYAGVASRRGWMPRDAQSVAIRIGALCAACLCLRGIQALFVDFEWKRWYAPTHLRIDSLFVGVLLSFVYHHERAVLESFVIRHRAALVVASGLLVLPALVFERSRKLMYTVGHTSLAVGFGVLIVLMLTSARIGSVLRQRPWNVLCIAGAVLLLGVLVARRRDHHD
jgi:peptidoglycan/LPS O-acetylase OafA/YrhL